MLLLLTHANTPYFDETERVDFEKRFLNLIASLASLDVSCCIRSHLAVAKSQADAAGIVLDNQTPADQLTKKYDFIISTPSTILLDFMEQDIPIMQFIIRPGPPMLRSAYMSFCQRDDIHELNRMVDDCKLKVNPRMEIQNNVFKREYFTNLNLIRHYDILPLVKIDQKFVQFGIGLRTSVHFLAVVEIFLSSIKTLAKRKRF